MNKLLAFFLLLLAPAAADAQTAVQWGNNSGTVCAYDTSAARPCVTVGTLNPATHTFTLTAPATLSAPTSIPTTATVGTGTVAASAGALTNGHCVSINSVGQFVDAGGTCTTGGGGGTVSSGTIGQLANYTGATAVGSFALAGDCTFSTPNITCTKTSGSAFAASATTDATNATNIGSGTLAVARLPAFAGGDCTSSAGSSSLTCTKLNGQSVTLAGSFSTSGAYAVTFTATGATNVTLPTSGTLATTTGVASSISAAVNTALPSGAASSGLLYAPTGAAGASTVTSDMVGFRNRIINGGDTIDQRNAYASQTITAGAALAYTDDRFYVYSTGANVTGQSVARNGPALRRYQITGAASVTGVSRCQRIESYNSADLASSNATFSVDLSDSLLTTVNWQIWYANTQDTFGTIASPTVTSISSGSFTVNSTLTRYSTVVSIPSAATTGLQVCLSVGAQTSGTWVASNWQLEPGSYATPFELRPNGVEAALSQRFYWQSGSAIYYQAYESTGVFVMGNLFLPVTMRAVPTFAAVGTVTYANCNTLSFSNSHTSGASISINFLVTGSATVSAVMSASAEL